MLLAHADARANCGAYFWARARRFFASNFTLVLAGLWTIPVGVLIGLKPKLSAIAQPIAQVAASVPATALFPIILLVLIRVGGGLGIGSIMLLLLGTQWYILFNVIAGAIAIPTDLKEVCAVFRFGRAGALAEAAPARNFPIPDHRICDGIGRRLERQHRRGIFPISRADLPDHGTRSGDQPCHGHGKFSRAAGGDDLDGRDGGDDQSAALAAAVSAGFDAIPTGKLKGRRIRLRQFSASAATIGAPQLTFHSPKQSDPAENKLASIHAVISRCAGAVRSIL